MAQHLKFIFAVLGISQARASKWPAYCSADTVPFPPNECVSFSTAQQNAVDFLKSNMPPFDKPNAQTLIDGTMPATVQYALQARQNFGWAKSVPKDIWEDAVLPYASVNEARTDWRELLWKRLDGLFTSHEKSTFSLEQAALRINTEMWKVLGHASNTTQIKFKSEQTPVIFDPMSTILFGYASCTGISVTFVDALRTFGIPARVVGTPAWLGDVNNGNHNWAEAYLGADKQWQFIEGGPAGPGEGFDNPCDKWFCVPSRFGFDSNNNPKTAVYSTRFQRMPPIPHYPMAWDLSNRDIPGVGRTTYYNTVCSKCGHGHRERAVDGVSADVPKVV